ncbi:MAG: phospho-N-acetylmuramoyl-pentapeptide-transferase [Oscillospiraceae bacterium]
MIDYLTEEAGLSARLLVPAAVFLSFFVTFLLILGLRGILPRDQGRKFAVNGALSEGKPRGAGLVIVAGFILVSALTVRLDKELLVYLGFIFLAMLSGYLDDAAKTPWGELKKGIVDLVISAGTAYAFYYFNSARVHLALFDMGFTLHPAVFVALGTVLVWGAVNVTNCTDGVDGLCATLSVITLGTLAALIHFAGGDGRFAVMLVILCGALAAYLWFNASPSKLLMGDAGSRALGVVIALGALKTGSPLLFLLVAAVFIVDGGLGLVKLSFIRYLKWKDFLKNTRTPIHDHMRKNKGWSDTQVVFRFAIIQLVLCALVAAYLIN